MKRLFAVSLVSVLPALAQVGPSIPTSPAIEQRVESLLSQLTPAEKISLLGGDRSFYIRPIPRLGLPEVKMADGPLGVRNYGDSTAYPATVGLAASFDVELAHAFGESLANDCIARGVDILLAPAVNIHRIPQNGRNFEYLSEDPFLAARIAPEIIQGIQSKGVVATLKHFAVNNQEYERMTVDVKVSERALREIYLPAFKAAVQQGEVWAVMDAYNLLNGDYCTANRWLNIDLLKKEWGFNGVVMSDWGAAHDTLKDANAGMDLEMPSAKYENEVALKPFLDSGQVTMATLDEKVRRILRLEVANGIIDRKNGVARNTAELPPKDSPQSAAVARKIADESIVLLKNERGLLPLSRSGGTIAVLGEGAGQYVSGGGSSRVQPFHSVTLLAGLKAAAGPSVTVTPLGILPPEAFDHYLDATTFVGPVLYTGAASPRASLTSINQSWDSASIADQATAHWSASVKAPVSGAYIFLVKAVGGPVHVSLDGKNVLTENHQPGEVVSVTLPLEAGVVHALKVQYMHRTSESASGSVKLAWGQAPDPFSPENTATLKAAKAVVVCADFGATLESEGSDRPFDLPAKQVELITKAAAINSHVIVVLMAGGAVATDAWLPSTQALVDAWYPGQEGGASVAAVLFGKVNPSGHLPMTFGHSWKDYGAYGTYPGPTKDHADYSDGILVGYRWFDAKGIEPLYPFGYGLSYTSFRFGRLQVAQVETKEQTQGPVYQAQFEVTNTGNLAGAEVAQLYIEPKDAKAPRPPRELKGFARLSLAPGETKTATILIRGEAFQRFDETTHGWITDPGRYMVEVGGSSRDLPLQAGITLP